MFIKKISGKYNVYNDVHIRTTVRVGTLITENGRRADANESVSFT